MTADGALRVLRGDAPGGEAQIRERFAAEELFPHSWANAPGDTYGWHAHGYSKVLYCVSGSITFHSRDGADVALEPGDRLEVDAGIDHSATVGPRGVECMEASR